MFYSLSYLEPSNNSLGSNSREYFVGYRNEYILEDLEWSAY